MNLECYGEGAGSVFFRILTDLDRTLDTKQRGRGQRRNMIKCYHSFFGEINARWIFHLGHCEILTMETAELLFM